MKLKTNKINKRTKRLITLAVLVPGVALPVLFMDSLGGKEVEMGSNLHGSPMPESDNYYIGDDEEDVIEKVKVFEDDSSSYSEEDVEFQDLFPLTITDGLTKEEKAKAHNETMETKGMPLYVNALNSSVDRYMKGTFSWNYKDKENENDFLAFRGGDYHYNENIVDSKKLYEETYEKIVKGKLLIEHHFEYDIEDIFVHPLRGGYVISGELSLRYHSDNGTRIKGKEPDEWFKIPYEVEFDYKTPHDTDDWEFWSDKNLDLLLKGKEFSYE